MPCKHHKNALIEVAGSGTAPQGELRAHLDGCASCRAAFDQEQFLFAAIVSGLYESVNAEVPTSLLPRVRVGLNRAEVRRLHWFRPLVFASASAALVLAIFLTVRPNRVNRNNEAKQGAVVVPASTAPATRTNPDEISSGGTQIATIPVDHSHLSENSTGVHSAASGNVEVLVPPDEREGLAQLVATLNERGDVAAALLAQRPENKDTPVTLDPLQISDIEIKPLEGAETETSDGTGEKR